MRTALATLAFFAVVQSAAIAKIPTEGTHAQVVAAIQAHMPGASVLVVGPMAQESNYIVTRWDTGDKNGKGEALLKYQSSRWIVVRSGGGSLENERYLESLGVPASASQLLVSDMKKL